jgi:hypothetical protein
MADYALPLPSGERERKLKRRQSGVAVLAPCSFWVSIFAPRGQASAIQKRPQRRHFSSTSYRSSQSRDPRNSRSVSPSEQARQRGNWDRISNPPNGNIGLHIRPLPRICFDLDQNAAIGECYAQCHRMGTRCPSLSRNSMPSFALSEARHTEASLRKVEADIRLNRYDDNNR